MPINMFAKKFNKEVPEYLQDLVESGIDIKAVLNLGDHANFEGMDIKTIKKVLSSMQSKAGKKQVYKSQNHK